MSFHKPGSNAPAFFIPGVPAIFMRVDSVARLLPDAWDLAGYRSHETAQVRDVLALRHELRHFHDAFFAPDLFFRFLLEVQGSFAMLNQMATGGGHQADLHNRFLSNHLDAVNAFDQWVVPLTDSRTASTLGIQVSREDVFEALSTAAEIIYLTRRASSEQLESHLAAALRPAHLLSRLIATLGAAQLSVENAIAGVRMAHRALIATIASSCHPSETLDEILPAKRRRETPDDVCAFDDVAGRLDAWNYDALPSLLVPEAMNSAADSDDLSDVFPSLEQLFQMRALVTST